MLTDAMRVTRLCDPALGGSVLHGGTIVPGEMLAEHASYGAVVLVNRLREAATRINSRRNSQRHERGLQVRFYLVLASFFRHDQPAEVPDVDHRLLTV